MYHDATGQRLTLYVSNENTGNTDTGFLFAQEGPVNVFYWINGNFGYDGIDKGELVMSQPLCMTSLRNSAESASFAPVLQRQDAVITTGVKFSQPAQSV